jgi:hypothetical protein
MTGHYGEVGPLRKERRVQTGDVAALINLESFACTERKRRTMVMNLDRLTPCVGKGRGGGGWRVITMRKKHSPRKRRSETTPTGYAGRAALRREQCCIFAQSKNCGAREWAVTSERL